MAKGHGVVVVIFIHTLQSRPAATLLSRRRKPIHALPTLDGIVGSLDFISSLSVLVVVVLSRIYERKWFSFGWSLKRERAERSVPRGQRDISMDGRVNEGLCVSSGVGSRAFEGEVEVNRCRLKRSWNIFILSAPFFVVSFVGPLFSHPWRRKKNRTSCGREGTRPLKRNFGEGRQREIQVIVSSTKLSSLSLFFLRSLPCHHLFSTAPDLRSVEKKKCRLLVVFFQFLIKVVWLETWKVE